MGIHGAFDTVVDAGVSTVTASDTVAAVNPPDVVCFSGTTVVCFSGTTAVVIEDDFTTTWSKGVGLQP